MWVRRTARAFCCSNVIFSELYSRFKKIRWGIHILFFCYNTSHHWSTNSTQFFNILLILNGATTPLWILWKFDIQVYEYRVTSLFRIFSGNLVKWTTLDVEHMQCSIVGKFGSVNPFCYSPHDPIQKHIFNMKKMLPHINNSKIIIDLLFFSIWKPW